MMNCELIVGYLRLLAGTVLAQWARLVGDDRHAHAGERLRLAGRTQVRHGIVQLDSAQQLREFLRRNRNWNSSAGR